LVDFLLNFTFLPLYGLQATSFNLSGLGRATCWFLAAPQQQTRRRAYVRASNGTRTGGSSFRSHSNLQEACLQYVNTGEPSEGSILAGGVRGLFATSSSLCTELH
jgi:hypothetical protein